MISSFGKYRGDEGGASAPPALQGRIMERDVAQFHVPLRAELRVLGLPTLKGTNAPALPRCYLACSPNQATFTDIVAVQLAADTNTTVVSEVGLTGFSN